MHLNQQPGVTISESMMSLSRQEMPTALPVFVGFTECSREDAESEHDEQIVLHAIDSFEHYVSKLGGPPPPMSVASSSVMYHTVKHYFDNGGDPCYVISAATYRDIDDITDKEKFIDKLLEAIEVVKQEPTITLLAVPDMLILDDDNDDEATAMKKMWTEVVKFVGEGKLFALLDPPASPQHARTCADALQLLGLSANLARCASYWPHLISDYRSNANDASSSFVRVAPSGAVAAAIQRIDRERGVWKAPANIALLRVVKPQYGPSHSGADESLFRPTAASINLIRSFPGRGVRIWGCRTLAADTPWQHIQVRRLVSYVESSLGDIARSIVFEPNNAITWFKLKGFATVWLRELWQRGGLYGTKEEQAFQVLVGLGESMTQTDILQGKLLMKIFLAVLQPAEFIELSLQFDIGDVQINRVSSPNRSVLA
ncbi:phage tail sheath C-terminal domain-containing protein [Burkholderia sp. MSMB1589WGS]|uniref:phage tail sheath family protein n=1 Tax=Burkholderia sp. MSMB1589WGS TaxID=1636425 RepID=UPI000B200C37|nr:phage tail sheath C-terminal domain-containing protein [Burkholderia sp. MSMB1589WGS]